MSTTQQAIWQRLYDHARARRASHARACAYADAHLSISMWRVDWR